MSGSVDVSALASRLERLETIEAARDALYRYAEGVDTRDWAMLAAAFSEDGVLALPGSVLTGRSAIVDAARETLPPELITRHLVVNAQVAFVGPGRATARATVHYERAGAGLEAIGWGDYTADLAIVDGLGLITRMVFTPAHHVPGSLPAVAARLERLETIEAAREASWRYAAAVDGRDFDLLAAVFADDAVLTTRRGSRDGRDEIVAYYRNALADPVERKHFLVNQTATWLEPGLARLESYFLYTYAGDDTSILGWGTYVDRVRVLDGVGHIEEKRISIDVHADSRIGWAGEITP